MYGAFGLAGASFASTGAGVKDLNARRERETAPHLRQEPPPIRRHPALA